MWFDARRRLVPPLSKWFETERIPPPPPNLIKRDELLRIRQLHHRGGRRPSHTLPVWPCFKYQKNRRLNFDSTVVLANANLLRWEDKKARKYLEFFQICFHPMIFQNNFLLLQQVSAYSVRYTGLFPIVCRPNSCTVEPHFGAWMPIKRHREVFPPWYWERSKCLFSC